MPRLASRLSAPPHPCALSFILAPTLITHGTQEQKDRFLKPLLRADEFWCQGFSEPGAGSDLSSLSTRAVRDGDVYRVTGQKVWTSMADRADWMFALVRTGTRDKRSDGITYLLIPAGLLTIYTQLFTTDVGLRESVLRMVGALVLVALAVIFLPMLLSREDEMRRVVVEAPAMPQAPAATEIVVEPAEVVEPEQLPQEPMPVEEVEPQIVEVPEQPKQAPVPAVQPSAPEQAKTEQSVATASAKPEGRLDANNLPVSWSVQLASLSSRAGAEKLQQTLRSGGYNAYIRSFDGMNRVFVGPVIERAEADRLRDQLNRQQKLNGFVVRFQPENG